LGGKTDVIIHFIAVLYSFENNRSLKAKKDSEQIDSSDR
jgi:hypothetical protein